MITVVNSIKRTCTAFPAQWHGLTYDDRQIYVRYRHGWLSIRLGGVGDADEFAAVNGEEIFAKQINPPHGGEMEYEELKAHTTGQIEWPEKEE